jgi:phage tail-like protein
VRGGVAGARSPHPIGVTLPALYADDAFAQRWCAALDEVLAPVIGVLDSFPAYLDPWTAPPDVLDWLASWVGLDAAAALPAERRRALVAQAADLHAWRGTPAAVRGLVQLATGREADLEESGGTMWSDTPDTDLPGGARPGLVVRVRRGDPAGADGADEVDPALLTVLLALVAPAHVPWSVEVLA